MKGFAKCIGSSCIWISLMMPFFLQAQSWERLHDLPRPRAEHANFVFQGEIYVVGGTHDYTYGPYNIEKYDPQTNKWTDVGYWPNHRHHVTAQESLLGNKLWICGGKPGGNHTLTNSVLIGDVPTNSWEKGPDLPVACFGAPSVIVGNELHVIGGAQASGDALTSHLVLRLDKQKKGWQYKAPLPKAVVHAAGVVYHNEIWILGGEIHHAHKGDQKWVQIYNPENNTWREGPDLPIARSHLEWSTFVYNDLIWSVNGVDSSKPKGVRGQDEILVFDPQKGNWSVWGKLPHNFTSTGAKIIADYLYVFGGGKDDWLDGSLREVYRTKIN